MDNYSLFHVPLHVQKNPDFEAGTPREFGVWVALFRPPSASQSPNFPKKKLKNSVSYSIYAQNKPASNFLEVHPIWTLRRFTMMKTYIVMLQSTRLRRLVECHQSFGDTYCFYRHRTWGSKFLCNVGIHPDLTFELLPSCFSIFLLSNNTFNALRISSFLLFVYANKNWLCISSRNHSRATKMTKWAL